MMCGPSHPGRSEWTPGGGKEGRWRRSRRATPARIPPPKGPGREESAFSWPSATGDVARSGLASARSFFPDVDGGSPPLSLSSSLALARRGRSWSPARLPPVELRVCETGRRRRRRGRRQGVSEGVRKRKGRKERTNAECRLSRVGRGRRNSRREKNKEKEEKRTKSGVGGGGGVPLAGSEPSVRSRGRASHEDCCAAARDPTGIGRAGSELPARAYGT